jgi:Lrp/AsnC family transcriptional regulator for asnA, asnC and gidA
MSQDVDDPINQKIISLLNENGRRSFTEMSTLLDISEAATRQRVNKLVQSGVIRIVGIPNPLTLGYARKAMIGIRHRGAVTELSEQLKLLPEVSKVVVTAGGFDVLIEVICEDDEHLVKLINENIRALPGVQTTETFVYLQEEKQIYEWTGK